MAQDDLTSKQQDYALFLPAIGGHFSTAIGQERFDKYEESRGRFPQGMTTMENLNWWNSKDGFFPYKWSLYSAGHASLDLNKTVKSEDMIRNREPGTFMLGDSGGFQIGKGKWEGDWRANSGCPKADKKRRDVLTWLDTLTDYAMILDIPTWIVREPAGMKATQITSHQEAVEATKFNNEYFINNRKGVQNGGTKFLNVLQGANHTDAEEWYETMKHYCDPKQYPDNHFNGWAMGGQNMCDIHLILKRLITLKYDGLLQEGVHDWMHFLGTSKLEWAVLLTAVQRAVRKHANPNFQISFDCASPFLAAANGQVYHERSFPNNGRWSYRMYKFADDKKYSTDTRKLSDAVVQDGFYKVFQDSPVSDLLQIKDVCYYKPGDLNKIGKEGKSSWDGFSYILLKAHNCWMHLTAVQEANRRYDAGEYPKMMRYSAPSQDKFEDVVERIFAAPTREASMELIEQYDSYWLEIAGTRGYTGKKAKNANTMFNALFDNIEETVELDDEQEFNPEDINDNPEEL